MTAAPSTMCDQATTLQQGFSASSLAAPAELVYAFPFSLLTEAELVAEMNCNLNSFAISDGDVIPPASFQFPLAVCTAERIGFLDDLRDPEASR